MKQRGFGVGTLEAVRQGGGSTLFLAKWRDAAGRRKQRFVASDRRTAERILHDIIEQRDQNLAGLKPTANIDIRFDPLVARYLPYLATKAKPLTVTHTKLHLARMRKILGNCRAMDITKEHFADFQRRRLAEGCANNTINRTTNALSAMLNFAVKFDLIPRNPLAGISRLPIGRAYETKPRRPFSEAELDLVLKTAEALDAERAAHHAAATTIANGTKSKDWCAKERPLYVPQTPFLRALAYTGARLGELAQIAWADYDAKGRMLTIRAENAKTKKTRRIPLLETVERDLARLFQLQAVGYGRDPKPDEPVFLTPEGYALAMRRPIPLRFLNEVLERAKITKIDKVRGRLCIHSLRHTFASMLARANAGLTQAQVLLGHADPKMTAAIYTHHDEQDLRAAVDKLRVG